MPCRRHCARIVSCSAREIVQPVGLFGELRYSTRVPGFNAANNLPIASVQPAAEKSSATVVTRAPRIFGTSAAGWTLDMGKLLAALKPGTRVLYLNSPNNPTGWTISRAEQETILAQCRRHGIWIFADDAYERLYFGAGGVAASFFDVIQAAQPLISTNTFSKSWLMTGWRLGWLVVPPSVSADLGKLIEYNTS